MPLSSWLSRTRFLARCERAREARQRLPESVHVPLLLSLLSVIALAGPGMAFLAPLPPVQLLFGDLGCPSGWHIVGTFSAICQQGPHVQALSGLFRVACGALTAALAAIVGLVLTWQRWSVLRRRQKWESLPP